MHPAKMCVKMLPGKNMVFIWILLLFHQHYGKRFSVNLHYFEEKKMTLRIKFDRTRKQKPILLIYQS